MVTINYRLGPFGWATSSALANEDPKGSTGNAGLQDQRKAMEWVQDNIAAFGGDPTQVTIFGQSAGAASVSTHLVAPASWGGLFHRAIIESGPWTDWATRNYTQSAGHYNRLAAVNGCGSGSADQVLACLRSLPWKQLVDHQADTGSVVNWAPTVDGVELTDLAEVLGAQGKFIKNVSVMLGTTTDEASTFITGYVKPSATPSQYVADLNKQLGSEMTQLLMNLYPLSNYTIPWWAAVDLFTDAFFTCPARRTARFVSGAGASVYLYHWTWELLYVRPFDKQIGVFHGSEIPFVFQDDLALVPPIETDFATVVSRYWTSFANGDPNMAGINPYWPAYNARTDLSMEMNPLANTPFQGLKRTQCDFWDKVFNQCILNGEDRTFPVPSTLCANFKP
jgi:para-nitrobenzyl esterase